MLLTTWLCADTKQLRRVAGNPQGLPLHLPGVVDYPQTVELNESWMIGALGQERDIHFAFALHVQVRFLQVP
jgi:hypothetical protein